MSELYRDPLAWALLSMFALVAWAAPVGGTLVGRAPRSPRPICIKLIVRVS